MKYLLLLSLLLSGCSIVTKVSPEAFKIAEEKCKNNDGVDYILVYHNMVIIDVVCKNGATFENVSLEK
jgi:hypothetical protein